MRGILTKHIFRSSVAGWAAVMMLVAGVPEFGTARASQLSSQSTSPSTSQSPQQSPAQSSPAQNSGDQKPSDQKSTEQGPDNGDITRIRVGTNEVNVVFTVNDKHGQRVTH